MFRSLLAGVAGLGVAVFAVGLVEYANSVMFPFPPGMDMHDTVAIAAFIKTLPPVAFGVVWAAWALGAFLGTLVTKKLTPGTSQVPAIVVAVLFAAFCVMNMLMLPHPLAFIVASIVTTPLASLAALKLGGRPPAALQPAA